MSSRRIETCREAVGGWLEALGEPRGAAVRWPYNAGADRPYSTGATALAVMVMWSAGLLERAPGARRGAIADEIRSWQDARTGLFVDPLLRPEHRVRDQHSWEHIHLHNTGMCCEALACLGSAPAHPTPGSAFGGLTEATAEAAVLGLGWENPWLVGEHFSRMVDARRAAAGGAVSKGPGEAVEIDGARRAAFAVLEREVLSAETGLPGRVAGVSPQVAMAGLFKIMFAYLSCGREVPNARAAIDTVLAMQAADGGFGWDNLCIHWDALWVLKNLDRQLGGGYRFGDIRRAGARAAEMIAARHAKGDGAFCFHSDLCPGEMNSVRVSERWAVSDVLGTMMSLESYRYADAWERGEHDVRSPQEVVLWG